MITKEQVMPLLLNDCPSFSENWREHLALYGDEQLITMDLGAFADHIIDLYEQNQTQEFPAVFDSIERLHIEGDDDVRVAAIIGLLEGIQNTSGHRGVDPEVFAPYLKPESAKWWKKLNDFWNGDIRALNSP
ncbi:MAG TPA: hypothetical protein VFV58_15860 [Blastocatellia bacterium]|nr:hypothetical protein [Blastocatellia bacterium]